MELNEAVCKILDYLIIDAELREVILGKNNAVRSQRFDDAIIFLEKQRALESRLPSSDQLKEIFKIISENKCPSSNRPQF